MYRMAAYCRLSKDDGENKMSESIENQIKLIREYAKTSKDLEIVDVYIDDGYSGLYFANRPEFQRMMEDIYKGRIQGVITKDISRLGREYIETGNYIERVFPALNVRYIAILDGVDSLFHRNEELAQFKTLFNDMYSRDISKKIKGALTAQKKRGQFMSGFAPYGYMKHPQDKHCFIVDEKAAEIVRRIYNLYLEGYSVFNIAKKLNEEGVFTPSQYKRKVQGLKYSNAREKLGAEGWSYSTIDMILKNRVYTGAMVQHKSEKISYKIKKCRCIPEHEQYIVPNMHEAIISKETFEQVQDVRKKRTRTPAGGNKRKKVNPYGGILVCGDCGCHLQRVTSKNGYECGLYHRKGNTVCCSHFIKKEILDHVVSNEIQKQVRLVLKETDRDEILGIIDRKKAVQNKELVRKKNVKYWEEQLDNVQKYKKKTYENYMDGILNKEEYLSYTAEYEQKRQQIQTRIKFVEVENENCEKWIEKVITDQQIKEVTRGLVVEFIDKIVVNKDSNIEIKFKYGSPYKEKEQEVEEMPFL